jgi:hypothetical protein
MTDIVYDEVRYQPSYSGSWPTIHPLPQWPIYVVQDSTFSCAFRVGKGCYQIFTGNAEKDLKALWQSLCFLVTQAVHNNKPVFVPVTDREPGMLDLLRKDPRIRWISTTQGSHGNYKAHIYLIDPHTDKYELRSSS